MDLQDLLAKLKAIQANPPSAGDIPLPNGGLQGEDLKQAIQLMPGPQATIGQNPNNPSPAPSASQAPAPAPVPTDEEEDETPPSKAKDAEEDDSEEEAPSPKASVPSREPASAPTSDDKTLDLGTSPYSNPELVQQALDAKNRAAFFGQLGKASSLIGSGIAGLGGVTKPTETSLANATFDENAKQGGQQLQTLQALRENEATDPNSPLSQGFRQYAAKLGINIKGDFSAEAAKQLMPYVFKGFEAEETRKEKSDDLHFKYSQLAAMKQQTAGNKATNDQAKALQNTEMMLESARGNPAVAQAEKDLYSVQKAKSLATMYGDPNKLSTPQVKLLVSEIAKVAQGGVPAMSELSSLSPNTLYGSLSTAWSKLSNAPTPAHAAEFVKQYQDYANKVAQDAQQVITDKYGRIINARKGDLGQSNYQNLNDIYINRFKQPSSGDDKSKPQQVIQNGHTYTLNPTTGQYE